MSACCPGGGESGEDGVVQLIPLARSEKTGDYGDGPHGEGIGDDDGDHVELYNEAVGGLYVLSDPPGHEHVGQAYEEVEEHDKRHGPCYTPSSARRNRLRSLP